MSEWQSSWTPKIGMKVVCLNDNFVNPNYPDWPQPQSGGIYTIEDWRDCINGGHTPVVRLVELSTSPNGMRWWWNKDRFRPLIKRKTDISIFQAMLKDTRESIDA